MAHLHDGTDFEDVTQRELVELLWGWIRSTIDRGELVDFADAHLPDEGAEIEAERQQIFMVLDALSTLFAQPLTEEDGLVLLNYLLHRERDPEYYDCALEEYWESIDWEARRSSREPPDEWADDSVVRALQWPAHDDPQLDPL